MFQLIRNILVFLHHHSYHELLERIWRAAAKPLYKNVTHYIVKLDLKSAAAPDPNHDIKELTTADINKMLGVMYVSRAGLQERFSRGDRCFAILDDDKIVSYFWAQFGLRNLCELRLKFNLSPNQVWFYNAITIKSARGRGYYPNIIRYMAKVLRAEGFDELFIDVEGRNTASIRGVEKAGCKRVVKVQMKELLSKVKYRVTIFDEDAWQRLSGAISDYPQKQCVTEEMANES